MTARLDAAERISEALHRSPKGIPHQNAANSLIILRNDYELTAAFAFNAFRMQTMIFKAAPAPDDFAAPLPGPYPRLLQEEDISLVQAYVQRMWLPNIRRDIIADGIATVAKLHRFHPVMDYISKLIWDGVPRIDYWLTQAFGCPDDAYHRAIGAKLLVAAVRRIRDPGCQFDHMLVLEGLQNLGKSRCCLALAGAQYFTDDMPADFRNKDSPLALLGTWIVELSEIDQLIRQDVEVLKAFLSRRVDRFRPPYGRQVVEQPRQCIFIGTTNSDDYLRDSTGNRRIWPVRCVRADFGWIAEHRDQLWAEAVAADIIGEPIWLDTPELAALGTRAQAERLYEDEWTAVVREHIEHRTSTTARDVLAALNIPTERHDKRAGLRVASILRCLGWVRVTKWNNDVGAVQKKWVKPHLTNL